ncbi:DEAD/DEAH box helicase [Pseudorhodoferax sp. Leaf265]|uniref:DEAD/DEAH box helicase n=1 Tax=Pseudorhodoferax sp. Leaf265 TaxID=1736315 RepID=UPI0006F2620D|nr:DEAD/DEAH box helicase [Pseudorhodoferax sp. Leaf265]KQP11594.1 ATP-dependent DNA helicase [Pseudorhodoferax sp. Leaf265]
MSLRAFHPAVAAWFRQTFRRATPAQRAAWPSIRAGRHTLVAAPTGSGKTLTAFLAALDDLVRQGLSPAGLADGTQVVYVSPLKALSNDIALNLTAPLEGIRAELAARGLAEPAIRVAVRTGDTPARERALSIRQPPHILVTTPESLYVLLGSASGRRMLGGVRTVIVDEIHALAANKRGSHLALSLERLQHLTGQLLTRIGLSATQKPIEEVARFLVGAAAVDAQGRADCAIVDIGYAKRRDLGLELPPTPLAAVMSNAQWEQVYGRVAELALAHRTTLVFVNTRRMAERATRHLAERLGKEAVAAHHGSLSRELRLDAEQRLKRGELRLLVATASLELGLDIGEIDLVCQLGSPRAISTFLQRAGRSGHAVGGVPKARLFPQSQGELLECAALLDCVRRGELDTLSIVPQPLDVLAQQIVAETACQEWHEDALYALVRRAWPYAGLPRADFDAVVRMLAEGTSTRQGQRGSYVHRDAVHQLLRERKGARMTALTSGGTIPDAGDYTVLLEPQAQAIGNVNEDFAVESLAGDVFQLGNTSYRILKIEPGRVRVEDAQGAAPNIPFWLGEAPGRSDALSLGVSRLRAELAQRLRPEPAAAREWLQQELALDEDAAQQLIDPLDRALAVLGALPTQQCVVLERFFDASGGMQLVLHAPFGSRLNRAWGLALRKRFCRSFNFELQAAATDDAIVLSLSTSHSFPLEEVARYLHPATALDVLVQAVLDAPLFGVRWRWNATTALALPRFAGGRRVAPQLQRMKSEDLLAAVFPDQVACAENLQGPREVPEHPLVAQTLRDCLHEAMDSTGWLRVLQGLFDGSVAVVARDLPAPSPLAAEALNAKPYAFLDDAPLEERRTQAVQNRRYADPGSGDTLGQLDPGAIASVREQAWPQARTADELHEALCGLGVLTAAEVAGAAHWPGLLQQLVAAGRATKLALDGGAALWVAAERLALLQQLHPKGQAMPPLALVPASEATDVDEAATALLRMRLSGLGPVTPARLAADLQLSPATVQAALAALQREGSAMQGVFTPGAPDPEWCERHLLARIHRYTLHQLRREIEPVEPRDFMRFLFDWQHVGEASRMRGPEALGGLLAQLEGYEAPAAVWEAELLPARLADYTSGWLDELTTAGRSLWARLRPADPGGRGGGAVALRTAPIVLLPRRHAGTWTQLAPMPAGEAQASGRARRVLDWLAAHGASFFDEIEVGARLLPAELEDALAELVAHGQVHCDSTAGLRALMLPAAKRNAGARRRRGVALFGVQDAGRWTLVRRPAAEPTPAAQAEGLEHVAHALLRRYGVVCWNLLEREAPWLPRWRDLVRVYRRLEARGELRGGRFIAGVAGEQFALPEAIAALRQTRRQAHDGQLICLAASDPANLLGSILPGSRVPRQAGARVLYRDGLAIASWTAGRIEALVALAPAEQAEAARVLGQLPAPRPQPVLSASV